MNRGWLIWQLSWRSILRGLVYGALCGALFALSFIPLILLAGPSSFLKSLEILGIALGLLFFGGLLGGIIGTGVGVVLAFLINIITIAAFLPLHDSAHYLKTAQRWCTIIGGLASLIMAWFIFMVLFGFRISELPLFLLYCVLPAIFATAALWRNSYEVARWYTRTAEAHTHMETSIQNIIS